jgi:hypothetical protein
VNPGINNGKPVATSASAPLPLANGFAQYWYQGKAELSTFTVTQERYGELRDAEQVNVFVTEDFSKTKQVKLDDAAAAGADRLPVFKLNTVRRFHTGIYDYSLMQSVFVPIDGSPAVKLTTTVQDWCGHVFSQLNANPEGYAAQAFSYFETEGDPKIKLGKALLEEELMVRIRLNPATVPTGAVKVVPSQTYLRMRHKPLQVEDATISIGVEPRESVMTLQYTQIPRQLVVRFESAFPHRILSWEENVYGKLMSKGVLKASLMSPYWMQHGHDSDNMRDSLKLTF